MFGITWIAQNTTVAFRDRCGGRKGGVGKPTQMLSEHHSSYNLLFQSKATGHWQETCAPHRPASPSPPHGAHPSASPEMPSLLLSNLCTVYGRPFLTFVPFNVHCSHLQVNPQPRGYWQWARKKNAMEEESSKRNLKAKSGSQFLNILRQRQQQRTWKTVSPVLKLFNNISFFGLKRKPRSLKLVFNKSNITHRYVCINFF